MFAVGDEVRVRLVGTCVEGRLGIIAGVKDTEEGQLYMIDLLHTEPPFDLHMLNLPGEELDRAAW